MSGFTARSTRRLLALMVVALVAAALFTGEGTASAKPKGRARPARPCTPRVLVLSAFPAEIGPLLEAAALDRSRTVELEGRQFWVGKLAGNDVVLALTGIGPANADKTTRLAFDHFRCGTKPGIGSVVFSGVAGAHRIGDVAVPTRWTPDKRKTWIPTDAVMLGVAQQTAPVSSPKLENVNPLGDPLCACIPPGLVKTVQLSYQPQVVVGGDGETSDPFGGRALPCVPNGGDVFGCQPCREQDRTRTAAETARFVPGILPFIPDFFLEYMQNPQETDDSYAAQDEETAAVGAVALANNTPFIGFRAGSDGGGDPLMLPGFPFQFFFYKQLAADNAAIATIDFLTAWATR